MNRWITRTRAIAFSIVVGSLALSGCASSAEVAAGSDASTPPAAVATQDEWNPPPLSVAQMCSQISVLSGIQDRYRVDEMQGLITSDELNSVMRVVTDAFVYFVATPDTEIHSEIEALRTVARTHPEGGPELDEAIGVAALACSDNGAPLSVMMRSGQGG